MITTKIKILRLTILEKGEFTDPLFSLQMFLPNLAPFVVCLRHGGVFNQKFVSQDFNHLLTGKNYPRKINRCSYPSQGCKK